MPFNCSDCEMQLPSVDALCYHLKILHSFTVLKKYKCKQGLCVREYDSLRNFKSHLLSKHSNFDDLAIAVAEVGPQNHVVENIDLDVGNNPHLNVNDPIFPPVQPLDLSSVDLVRAVHNSALAFCGNLYASSTLNRSHVQDIVDHATEFLASGFLQIVKDKAMAVIARAGELDNPDQLEDDIHELQRMFDVCMTGFQGLESEHLRFKALEESSFYIAPESYVIGDGEKFSYVRGELILQPIDVCGQHIPMGSVLKSFFELPGVLSATLRSMDDLAGAPTFSNFVQGELWQRIKSMPSFEGKLVLPLFLYFDDVEPDNVAGSHSGSHKVGALYYNIPCIPSECLSDLDNTFLASIFLSDGKQFGNSALFSRALNDLIDLETNGVDIVTPEGTFHVYFAMCLMLGDNLGVHSVLGLVESFSANHPCYICFEHKTVTRAQFKENVAALRTVENYAEALAINDVSLTGINSLCIWNVLLAYHLMINKAVDIMHDLLEGVLNYNMCAILRQLIYVLHYFDLETLNSRVQGFDYGPVESGNIPPLITRDHINNDKLRFSATEMLCFVRYFGLFVGDLVDEADENWKFYLLNVQILDIVIAPYVDRNSIDYLSTLIEEHHEMYVTLYRTHLKPKHHSMVHYGPILLSIGPLIHVSSLTFERMHRPTIKQVAKATNSRRNLPLTVAKKHQLKFCARLMSKKGFATPLQMGPNLDPQFRHSPLFAEFRRILPHEAFGDFCVVAWINSKGTLYKVNMVLVVDYHNDLPVFASIKAILISPDKFIYFLLTSFITIGFNERLHCFHVRPGTQLYCVQDKDLVSYMPTMVRTGVDGMSYITFRYIL